MADPFADYPDSCTVCEESHTATHYCATCPHALCGMMANVHTKQKAFKHHVVQLVDYPGLADRVRDKIDSALEGLNKARTDLFVEYADALPCRSLLNKNDPQALDEANEVFRVVIEAGAIINHQHKDLIDRRRSLGSLHPLAMRAILADPLLFQTDLWLVELKKGLSGMRAVLAEGRGPPSAHEGGPVPASDRGMRAFDIGTRTRGDRPGQFDRPSDVSISHHREVYVCDALNHRIQVFRLDGRFLRMWDVPQVKLTPYAEAHTFPVGVVVASWDDVFVIKKTPRHVYVFHPDGSFLRTWKYTDELINASYAVGVAANNHGEVIVMCKKIQVFTPEGAFLRAWEVMDQPEGLCVSPTGLVYVVSKTTCHMYNRRGNELAAWDGLVDASGVSVSTKGEVFVTEASGVRVFDARGVFLRYLGSESASAVTLSSDHAFICLTDAHVIEVVETNK